MDGNYKSIYPEKKKKWPNEEQQKNAEKFEESFKKGPGMFEKLKEWLKKKEQK